MKKKMLEELMCALADMPSPELAEEIGKKSKGKSYAMEVEMELDDEDEDMEDYKEKRKKKYMEA